jgi:hypothetical protein
MIILATKAAIAPAIPKPINIFLLASGILGVGVALRKNALK